MSEPLASRVLRRSIVSNWANSGGEHDPDALLEDVLEGRAESVEKFREAVELRTPAPHLGRSENHLVWSSPSEDLQGLRGRNPSGREVLEAMGLSQREWMLDGPRWEEGIEIVYPMAAAGALYKPCAVHAGPTPLFSPTDVKYTFGQTPGGLREMVHRPLEVREALRRGARFLRWEMP